jgi:hypothetical protein
MTTVAVSESALWLVDYRIPLVGLLVGVGIAFLTHSRVWRGAGFALAVAGICWSAAVTIQDETCGFECGADPPDAATAFYASFERYRSGQVLFR